MIMQTINESIATVPSRVGQYCIFEKWYDIRDNTLVLLNYCTSIMGELSYTHFLLRMSWPIPLTDDSGVTHELAGNFDFIEYQSSISLWLFISKFLCCFYIARHLIIYAHSVHE